MIPVGQESDSYFIAIHYVALHVHTDQVANFHHGEMHSQRIDPESIAVLRIADADVSSNSFGVAQTTEDSEGACEVFECPLTLLSIGDEFWNALDRYIPVAHSSKQC